MLLIAGRTTWTTDDEAAEVKRVVSCMSVVVVTEDE